MPTSIDSTFDADFPTSFVETQTNELLCFNGLIAPRRWDGVTAATETAGIEQPSSNASVASGAAGSPSGTYVCYVNFEDDEGIMGNLNATGASVTVSSQKVEWTSVPQPSDDRPTKINLWRSLAGQTSVVYLVTTLNDGTTTYSDNVTDATLGSNEAITVSNSDGTLPARAYTRTVPPDEKVFAVEHRNRIYAGGSVDYNIGHAEMTNSDATVTGVGTNWTTDMAGRLFIVKGQTTVYTISSVTSSTELELTTSYTGTNDFFAEYSIESARATVNEIRYTAIVDGSAEPESWPATYAFNLPAHGGKPTAAFEHSSFLMFAKQSSLYRFSVQDDPLTDGGAFLASGSRGCENHRCWCLAEGVIYALDREGIYRTQGGAPEPISDAIQDLFRKGKINWNASKYFHAIYDQEFQTIKFFVALWSDYLPKQALCYHTQSGVWWIEDYPWGVGGSALLRLGSRKHLSYGVDYNRIMLANSGSLDGIAPNTVGTLRGTVSGSSLKTISDSTATFASGLAGVPISIVDGRGKGQTRIISSISGTTISVKTPWKILPSASGYNKSTYQIGGFKWEWVGTLFRATARSQDTTFEASVSYDPVDNPNHIFFRYFNNHNKLPENQGSRQSQGYEHQEHSRVEHNDPNVFWNIKKQQHRLASDRTNRYDDEGFKRYQFDDNRSVKGESDRFWAPGLMGHSAKDAVRIYSLTLDGAR